MLSNDLAEFLTVPQRRTFAAGEYKVLLRSAKAIANQLRRLLVTCKAPLQLPLVNVIESNLLVIANGQLHVVMQPTTRYREHRGSD